jgi:hypothetical protein
MLEILRIATHHFDQLRVAACARSLRCGSIVDCAIMCIADGTIDPLSETQDNAVDRMIFKTCRAWFAGTQQSAHST